MGRGDRDGQEVLLTVGPSDPVGDKLEEGELLLDCDWLGALDGLLLDEG